MPTPPPPPRPSSPPLRPQVKAQLLECFPWLNSSSQGMRFDGLYFAIRTPSVSGLGPHEFNFVSPDNVLRAFRYVRVPQGGPLGTIFFC